MAKLEQMLEFIDNSNRARVKEILLAVLEWRPRPSDAHGIVMREMALLHFDKLNEDPKGWASPTRGFLHRVCRENENKFDQIYRRLK